MSADAISLGKEIFDLSGGYSACLISEDAEKLPFNKAYDPILKKFPIIWEPDEIAATTLHDDGPVDIAAEKMKSKAKKLEKLVDNSAFIPDRAEPGSPSSSTSYEKACRNRPGTCNADWQVFPPDESTPGPTSLQQRIQYLIGRSLNILYSA